MKITIEYLKQIIKEELKAAMTEQEPPIEVGNLKARLSAAATKLIQYSEKGAELIPALKKVMKEAKSTIPKETLDKVWAATTRGFKAGQKLDSKGQNAAIQEINRLLGLPN
jgi:uncharacterized protein with PhoU and TrkA domain